MEQELEQELEQGQEQRREQENDTSLFTAFFVPEAVSGNSKETSKPGKADEKEAEDAPKLGWNRNKHPMR